jgi:hypothetical protein
MPSTHSGTEARPATSRPRMSNSSSRSPEPPSRQPSHTLTERVLARVRDAEAAMDLPPSRRRQDASSHSTEGGTPEQVRRARSLRRVFVDLGTSYREFRRRTGAHVSPEVRAAAYRFRREGDVTSLVGVAASLDQLEALPW